MINQLSGTVIEVNALSCCRDSRHLFHNLSFTLDAGHLLNLVGQNGSGKTTLLRILCGLREPDSGSIRCVYIAGQFAFIGHNLSMKNNLTVIENLRFWHEITDRNVSCDIDNILNQLKLAHLGNKLFKGLSAGQKRRTCLATLLINPKPIWLLDEPFTSLDSNGMELVQNMIINHLHNNGTVIITSHQQVELNWPNQQSLQLGS